MFVRKKKNKSGTVSVQVIDKRNGYRVVKTVGCSANKDEIEQLMIEAQQIIHATAVGQKWLFPWKSKEELIIETFVKSLANAQIRTLGPELIFGALFDSIVHCNTSY